MHFFAMSVVIVNPSTSPVPVDPSPLYKGSLSGGACTAYGTRVTSTPFSCSDGAWVGVTTIAPPFQAGKRRKVVIRFTGQMWTQVNGLGIVLVAILPAGTLTSKVTYTAPIGIPGGIGVAAIDASVDETFSSLDIFTLASTMGAAALTTQVREFELPESDQSVDVWVKTLHCTSGGSTDFAHSTVVQSS